RDPPPRARTTAGLSLPSAGRLRHRSHRPNAGSSSSTPPPRRRFPQITDCFPRSYPPAPSAPVSPLTGPASRAKVRRNRPDGVPRDGGEDEPLTVPHGGRRRPPVGPDRLRSLHLTSNRAAESRVAAEV